MTWFKLTFYRFALAPSRKANLHIMDLWRRTLSMKACLNYRCLFVSCLSEIVCDSRFTRGKSLTVLPLTQLVERNDYVQQTRMEYIGAQFDSLVYNMRPNVCLVLKCHICISIFSRFKREKQKYEYHNDSIQRPGRLFAFVT